MEEKEKELTPKLRLFCEYYVCGFTNNKGEKIKPWNGTKSYLESHPDSGYDAARSSASTVLTKPNIKQYIEDIQKDILKLAGISRFTLVKDLIDIKDEAEQDKDKIKAIEVINKMTGLNEPEKIDHTTKGDKIGTTKDMSTEELILRAGAVKEIETPN